MKDVDASASSLGCQVGRIWGLRAAWTAGALVQHHVLDPHLRLILSGPLDFDVAL